MSDCPDPRARYIRSLQYGTLAALLLLIGAFTAPVDADEEADRLVTDIGPVPLEPILNTVEPEAAPPPPPPPAPPPPIEVPDDVIVEDEVEAVEFDPDVIVTLPDPPARVEDPVTVVEPVRPPDPVVEPPVVDVEDDPSRVWELVEQEPVLVGGMEGLAERLVYPEFARTIGAAGTVLVQFVVDERGSVTDAVVLRSPHESLSQEALRVVRESRFQPGQQRGRPVKVRYTLPVRFTLR